MRRPQRMWSAAICRKRCRSLTSSSSITLPPWRWVLRCWPTTRQASRSETRKRARKTSTAQRRRSGLRSFPSHRKVLLLLFEKASPTQKPRTRASPSPATPPPEASTPSEKPSARAGRSPSPAESAVWLPRPASPVLLSPAVVRRLRHLDDAADLRDGLALGDQLLRRFELADDLLGCVPGAFHGRIPGPVWPAEDLIHPGPVFGVHVTSSICRG